MQNERPHRRAKPARAKSESSGERIAKVIARAGLCSRRDAEAWIAEGRVAVNGKPLASPAVNVGPNDDVRVDGQPLAHRQRTRLFLFHKPRGLVATNKDPQGRPTVFDYLTERHPQAPRLLSVGRLDINTEGLLLLTNDGGLARVLELPATGWLRRYRARANGTIDQPSLDRLANGLTLDGVRYAGIEAKLDRVQGANCWLTIGLREGKNREIKRVLEHLGLNVNRLIRVSFGPFQLGELAEGGLEEVRARVLRDQLGPSLLQESGADLDAPIDVPRHQGRNPKLATPKRPPHSATGGRLRPHRAEPDALSKKSKGRPQPGPRKHVLALRAESEKRDEGGKSPRLRLERSETADRKGRVVAVERRFAAAPASKKDKPRQPSHRKKHKGGGAPRHRSR
jgi:23S rRNA pseudouridine2605 synthase